MTGPADRPAAIRDAGPEDREAVAALWSACLLVHGLEPRPAAFDRAWSLAREGAGLGLRVAEGAAGAPSDARREVAAFALHSWNPNTWTGGTDGCLDTLFVAPAARGQGLARALVEDLLALARRRGWEAVTWHVHAANAPARALYARWAAPDGYLRHRVPLG